MLHPKTAASFDLQSPPECSGRGAQCFVLHSSISASASRRAPEAPLSSVSWRRLVHNRRFHASAVKYHPRPTTHHVRNHPLRRRVSAFRPPRCVEQQTPEPNLPAEHGEEPAERSNSPAGQQAFCSGEEGRASKASAWLPRSFAWSLVSFAFSVRFLGLSAY